MVMFVQTARCLPLSGEIAQSESASPGVEAFCSLGPPSDTDRVKTSRGLCSSCTASLKTDARYLCNMSLTASSGVLGGTLPSISK